MNILLDNQLILPTLMVLVGLLLLKVVPGLLNKGDAEAIGKFDTSAWAKAHPFGRSAIDHANSMMLTFAQATVHRAGTDAPDLNLVKLEADMADAYKKTVTPAQLAALESELALASNEDLPTWLGHMAAAILGKLAIATANGAMSPPGEPGTAKVELPLPSGSGVVVAPLPTA